MDNPWYFTTYGFLSSNRESKCYVEGNHKTKSSIYSIIYHDELYIVSTTPQEILHMLQDKYKINLQGEFPHDPGGTNICQHKEYLVKLYDKVNILFKDKLPRDLHITFQIIKLLIEKENLNLIHNKKSYQHFNYLSRKRKLDKLYNEMQFMDYKTRFHIYMLYIKFHQPKHYLHFNIHIQETRKIDT